MECPGSMRTFRLAVASEGITFARTPLPACIVGDIGIAQHRAPHRAVLGEMCLPQEIGALQLFQRAHQHFAISSSSIFASASK